MKMTIRTRAVLTLALLLCALAGTALAIDYQSTIRDQASWDNTFFGLMNKNIKIENAQIENRKDVTATYLMISNSTLVNASSGILYFPDIYIDASSTLEAVGTIRSKIACYGELKILDRDACVPILCSIELLSGGTVRNQTSSALNVKIGGQSTSISANSLIMKLGTPANLTWNNRVLSWDAVTGASQYEIEAYQNNTLLNRLTISDNSYDFTELIKNNGAGAYKMKVCALGYTSGSNVYLVSNQAQTAYDLLTTPTMKRGSIYANGIPLVITEGSTNDRTQIYYDNGTGNPDIARGALNLTSAMRGGSGNTTDGYTYCDRVTIYGGCENECCPSTKITILSGRIYEIRAGGGKGNVNGNTVVKASGGRSSYIRGGGGDGVVKGNVDIDVAGNHVVLFDINGGGNPGRVNGNVSIRLSESASVYASLYAGGWSEGVDGDVSISLSDYASVGGGYGKGIYASTRNGDVRKTIKGDVSVEMTDYAYVYGLHGTDIIGSPIVEGDFTVTMQDSATAESIVAVPSNGVIRGDIRINLNQTAAYAIVNKLKGGKGISGLSTGISLGNGTHDFKINDSAITPGFYDSLLLRKKAVIRMLDNSYATRYTDGTQQLTLEEYKAGNRVLDIAVAPTTITPSAVEMFQIVQPSGTPGGTWYIDSTQTADMGLLKKATIAASTPVIGTASGLYPLPINVTLSCSTSGATLRYTLDGSEPTSTSAKYSSAVTVTNSCTLKVKAFKNGMLDSATESAIYTDAPVIDTPTFTPAAGTYITPQNVAISCTVSGVTIRYTTDGNDPTASSTVYTTPISVAASTTIKAKAYKTGMTESAMATAGYTISYISATVAPATASFDRYDGAASGHDDLTFTLTPGSYTLSAIKIGGSTLTLNSDYTANGNAYTIKKETLATLAAGTGHVITFDMSGGVDPTVALTVTDSAPAPIDPPASDNSIVGVSAGEIYTQGETVKFRAIGGNVSSAHPRVGDKRWLPTDWATNPHGTFNGAPYAASFSTESMTLGAHKLTVTFVKQTYNGSAWVDVAPLTRDQKSVSFVVKASAQPPQTGDRATPVGWAGLALLAIGGIVALASYRRKKRA